MITTDLLNEVLIKPVIQGADKLLIVSGYATSAMAFHHLEQLRNKKKSIEIKLIVGMTIQDGLSLSNHRGFQQLVEKDYEDKFFCSYIFSRPAVHSKVFVWLENDKPKLAFTGSANYTQNAFIRKQKEVLAECNSEIAFDYFQEISKDTIYCNHIDADNLIQVFSDKQYKRKPIIDTVPEQREQLQTVSTIDNLNELENVCTSFLDNDGNLPKISGLNWGFRPSRRIKNNEAYIRLPSTIYHTDFFPPIKSHFTVYTDDNKILICSRAQQNGKAIHTPHNNNLIGEYFRYRLNVPLGQLVLKEDLEKYGRTDVCFYKVDDETYYMDFSV